MIFSRDVLRSLDSPLPFQALEEVSGMYGRIPSHSIRPSANLSPSFLPQQSHQLPADNLAMLYADAVVYQVAFLGVQLQDFSSMVCAATRRYNSHRAFLPDTVPGRYLVFHGAGFHQGRCDDVVGGSEVDILVPPAFRLMRNIAPAGLESINSRLLLLLPGRAAVEVLVADFSTSGALQDLQVDDLV